MTETRIIETKTARFRIRDTGKGDLPILMATDPPNTVDHYDQLIDQLAEHARVIVMELPGFGFSRLRPGHRLGLSAQARAVHELMDALDATPCVLVFPCVTSFVALRVAAEHPESVAGLVLPQAPGWHQTQHWLDRIDSRRVLRTPGLGQLVNRVFRDRIVRIWYRNALADPGLAGSYTAKALSALHEGARFPLATAFQRIRMDDLPTEKLHQPALVVWGERDRSHRHSDPAGMDDHVEGTDIRRFPASGHFPELEDRITFSKVVVDWRNSIR